MPAKKPKLDKRSLEKLHDGALREFVAAGGTEPISAILEVDLPPQQVQVASRSDRLRDVRALARAVVEETPAQQQANTERIAHAHALLKDVLGAEPHWLSSARAFVFRATPEQLRRLAASELTRAIRVNRRLERADLSDGVHPRK